MTRQRQVRIASRGSELALWQSENVRSGLLSLDPDLEVQIDVIRTTGDKILDVPLAKIGDRGLFTKEIDETLLRGEADIAVHSLKDVPTTLPEGLTLSAITRREDPRDVLIVREGVAPDLQRLPPGSRIGTSSLRRRAQLRHLRTDLEIADIRGNLNTRIAKLDAGEFDALILASAGVVRLGWSDRIAHALPLEEWLPAVGQGALAIVARKDRTDLRETLRPLNHPDTASAVRAERAFLRSLEGGCQVPIGALATVNRAEIHLDGLVADLDGAVVLRAQDTGDLDRPEDVGTRLASALIARGAEEILHQIREAARVPGVPGP